MAQGLNINQFQNKIDAMLGALPKEMERVNVLIAKSAIPLITNRLTNEGKTAEGQSLGAYSDKPVSSLFFIGKSLGSGAEKNVNDYAKKNGGKLSYKKFRELNNRPTNHVTLSFSGETLEDVGILKTTVNQQKVSTIVGSLDRKSKDITNSKGKKTGTISTGQVLENLDEKYGSALNTELLALSKSEEESLKVIYEKNLQRFLDTYFK